jgi:hypothetical protein
MTFMPVQPWRSSRHHVPSQLSDPSNYIFQSVFVVDMSEANQIFKLFLSILVTYLRIHPIDLLISLRYDFIKYTVNTNYLGSKLWDIDPIS